MRTTRTVILLPALVALSACSSAPAPVTQPTATPTAAPTVAPVAALDLSPVPAPAGIFATGRAKSLSATLATLGLSGSQKDLTTGLVTAMVGRHGLRLDLDAEKTASVIAFDAPVDFVAAVPADGPPEPVVAFAVGVKSMDEAKAALGATREFEPGMWAFGGERSKAFCVVAAAAGPSSARVVCGASERDVHALGPYLTRTVPTQPSPTSDLNVELLVSPLNARFGGDLSKLAPQAPRLARSELGIGEPQFDKALEVAASGLADEAIALLGDVDKIGFNVSLAPQGGVTIEGTADYKGKRSWIARTSGATTNGPIPAFFFRAPVDSDSVTFGTVRDPADYAPILKVGKDLIEGGLAKAKVGTETERKKLSALLDLPFTKGLQIVSATGSRRITKSPAPKAGDLSAMFDSQMGWNVIGTNMKPDALVKWLKDDAAAYAQPGIQKELKKDLKDFLPSVKTPAAPAKLGKGAFELDVTMSFGDKGGGIVKAKEESRDKGGKDKAKPKAPAAKPKEQVALTFYVLVMADGDTSWVAVGSNRDELVERLLEAKAGAPKEKTLDSRADVQALKSQQVAAGGFLTVGSFRSIVTTLQKIDDGGGAGKSEQLFDTLPHKGQTPIVYQGTVTQSPFQSHFLMTVPKASIEDVTALVNALKR